MSDLLHRVLTQRVRPALVQGASTHGEPFRSALVELDKALHSPSKLGPIDPPTVLRIELGSWMFKDRDDGDASRREARCWLVEVLSDGTTRNTDTQPLAMVHEERDGLFYAFTSKPGKQRKIEQAAEQAGSPLSNPTPSYVKITPQATFEAALALVDAAKQQYVDLFVPKTEVHDG